MLRRRRLDRFGPDLVIQVKGTSMCVGGPSILEIATGNRLGRGTRRLGAGTPRPPARVMVFARQR